MASLEEDIIMGRSELRGHPLIWVDGKWVYEDDRSDIPANGGKIRPCKVCGKTWELGLPDPCLSRLPGVDNACCGHGSPKYSYIRFTNGVIIEGFNTIRHTEIF